MTIDHRSLEPAVVEFLTERHLATLSVLRPDGTQHVTPVGFTWDPEAALVRVITWADAHKIGHLLGTSSPRASVCQVDGARWLTLEGPAEVVEDHARCADAEARYAVRYRPPKQRRDRRVIEIAVDHIMGTA